MTWQELKDFCNNLPEEVLDKDVVLWREEDSITEIESRELEEDYYMNPEDDLVCLPESEMPTNLEDDRVKVYDRGFPILWERY